MIDDLVVIASALLMLAGSAFAAIAALGIVRLPDLYTRMHSASKAGAVGSGMLLIALALTADSTPVALRALMAVAFFLLTAPLSAHLLAKASYAVGYPLWSQSVLDEMPPIRPHSKGSARPNTQDPADRADGQA
ncbi:monovalent cation/H(+) antiporter subunit G [Aurantimonas sp. A2-1-M11]|uniref:monovalent cation/H(+) antiporter subunit G n=1 Tax=Aurantimonas sp. A2-1-M11 TaxID=3113712 RepID=UPI002F958E62